MFKISLILLIAITALNLSAQLAPSVNESAVLQFPTAEQFKDANDIASKQALDSTQSAVANNTATSTLLADRITNTENEIDEIQSNERLYPRIVIDCSPTLALDYTNNWSDFFTVDAEMKVYDAQNDELLYWVSTTKTTDNTDGYNTHGSVDNNAKIYFTTSAFAHYGNDRIDPRTPILFDSQTYDSILEQAIAMRVSSSNTIPVINSIIIEPNINGTTRDGTSIADIFTGEYVSLVLRISATDIERTSSENAYGAWRAIAIFFNTNQLQ